MNFSKYPLELHRVGAAQPVLACWLTVVLFATYCWAEPESERTTRFEIEVQAVLSKAGCNMGTCHGNQNGKGGFKLSLRGQDPWFDHEAIVSQNGGRRINMFSPQDSLLLQKPTMELAHQGGKRITRDSELYQVLEHWIATGARQPSNAITLERIVVSPTEAIRFSMITEVPITVQAEFSDGSSKDVTDSAVYETSNLAVEVSQSGVVKPIAAGEATVVVRYLQQQVPVRVAFLNRNQVFTWNERTPRNYIDEHIFAKLKKFRTNPAERCTDHVFLRRAFLDILGVLPTAEEARQFARSDDPNKRIALVDSLLARPEFADHWALKWADLLRVEEKVLDRKGVEVFHGWIRDSIAAGMPLNEFVAELLLARGSTYDNPPTNYFRALRKSNVRGEAAARVFLGTRLQCAQCHNHPFDRWTQDDYYAWSAVFARVDYEIDKDAKRLDRLDKNEFVGEQFVKIKPEGEVKNPTTDETMLPRMLGEASAVDDEQDRLESLAEWLTSPDNRQFARSQVNRIWYHMMGRGLVNPVDDFRVTNPASHPDLLERLTDDFISSGFDVRHLIRLIANSDSYQLQSMPQAGEEYAHVSARRLTAEQLLDAQSVSLHAKLEFNGHPQGLRAMQLPGVRKVRKREKAPSPADRFLTTFGKPDRLMTCECERSDGTTLSQALFMVNGACIDDLLTQEDNLLGSLLRDQRSLDEIIVELYWSALSREPTEPERNRSHSIIARAKSKREGLEDVAWALLNAKEFVFRQ